MTGEAFAALVDGRRTGNGKWQARCPAHQDRSPSLSIGVGSDGRVLLHCFAGCSHRAILAALGLSICDLFAGPPLSLGEQEALQRERARAREQAQREEDAARRLRLTAQRAEAQRSERLEGELQRMYSRLAAICMAGQPGGYAGETDALDAQVDAAWRELRTEEAMCLI